MEKFDWKKLEKALYLPGQTPERIDVPQFKYLSVDGRGEPSGDAFSARVEALFSLSYAIKMAVKKGGTPFDPVDYAVYPLEGIWDLDADSAPAEGTPIDKKALIYTLQIRQPSFVTPDFAQQVIALTRAKKPELQLEGVRFEALEEGPCLQIMHRGSFDSESVSFAALKSHMVSVGLKRRSHAHREIYLSDFRKTAPEALKTVLRVGVVEISKRDS